MAATKRKSARRSSRSPRDWHQIFRWVAVAAIWCVLIFGAIIGWYAAELPSLIKSTHFTRRPSITFKAADGSIIDRSGDTHGDDIDAKNLPKILVEAVLATEDRRFYEHHGIDPIGMVRALGTDIIHRHVVQGGSTITQQLAKNLFLTQERTFRRKMQEAMLAVYLEHEMTKDEILTAYLNRVYFGDGAYGIDAASRVYFGKSARDVDLRESAILAGMLKAPSRYSPQSNPGLAAQRAKTVLGAMEDAGYISKKQAESAALTVPVPQPKPTEGGGVHYFTDWTAGTLDALIGDTGKDLVVQTTFDPAIEHLAETALASALRTKGADRHISQGAVIVMDRSGAVRAMVGGRDYDASQFNRASQALRPPGSSFKPIVYLTALEQGWTPNDMIDGSPITEGKYRPQNFENEYTGPVPLYTALAMSLNTAAVRLAQQIGIGKVIATARRMGIRADLAPELATALGSNGVPMTEMITAYSVFANHGRGVNLFSITGVKDLNGGVVYERDSSADGMTLFDPGIIGEMNQMLQNDVATGTGTRAALSGHHAAGKTGTSEDYRDAWFIGFSDHYICAVWVGNDDNSPMKHETGGMIPAGIWHDIMQPAEDRAGPANDDAIEAPAATTDTPVAIAPAPPATATTHDGGILGVMQRIFSN